MKKAHTPTATSRFEALEARLLFSGDLAPVAVVAQPAVEVAPEQLLSAIELVVVDARVENQALLLQDIAHQQSQGRPLVVLEVNANDDGLAIISQAIENARASGIEISALHILSHGRDGEFDLGRQQVDQNFVRQNAMIFSQWASAFAGEGDILIYGCNFAQSATGQELANSIAALTGADVAANPQATGALALGGDWLLDYRTGAIEASDAISVQAQTTWQQLLQINTTGLPQVVGTGTGDQFTAGINVNSALNGDTSGGHTVAIDKNGNYAVAWNDVTTQEIKVQTYWANGTLRGAQATVGSLEFASIAMTENGDFVVAGSDRAVFRNAWVQRFNADGTKDGALTNVTSGVGTYSDTPSIAINNNKDYVVVWRENLNILSSVTSIVTRAFHWNGVQIALSYAVDIPNGNDQTRPAVAIFDNFAYFTWESDSGGSHHNILLRAMNIQTGSFSTSLQVNIDQTADHRQADISVNSSGRVVVAWQARSATAEAIKYRIFGASSFFGEPTLTPSPLTVSDRDFTPLSASLHEALPQVALDDSGKFLITAQVKNPVLGDFDIIGAQFDQLANLVGQEVFVTEVDSDLSLIAGHQFGASVAVRNSQAVVSWTSVPPPSGARVGNGFDVLVRTANVSAPTIVVTPFGLTLEEGDSIFVSVSLSEAPSQNVTLNAAIAGPGGIITPTTLIFTPSNWNVSQSLQVAAVIDHASLVDQNFRLAIEPSPANAGEFAALAALTYTFTSRNTDPIHDIAVTTNADDAADTSADTSSLLALSRNKGGDGLVSLREAMLAANNTATDAANPINRIHFDLLAAPGTLPVIDVPTSLPTIVRPVEIDGRGASGNFVELRGNNTGVINGLEVFGGLSGTDGGSGTKIRHMVIGGFSGFGIAVQASNVSVEENFIGTVPFGTPIAGNSLAGVFLYESGGYEVNGNKVLRNFISNNGGAGIYIVGADGSLIFDNTIGSNASHTSASGNLGSGIQIQREGNTGNTAFNNTISSNTIIANSGDGIFLYGVGVEGTVIQSNYLGTDINLVINGNNANGIKITEGASGSFINNNIIANNLRSGIKIASDASLSSINNEIIGNIIYSNGQMSIDLALTDGLTSDPTPNDADGTDDDLGSNGLSNFPVITQVVKEGAGTRFIGSFQGIANTSYILEGYASPNTDASLRGETRFFLGTSAVTTDATGYANLNFLLTGVANIGQYASVTATHINLNAAYGETSEVSPAIIVAPAVYFPANDKNVSAAEINPSFTIDAKLDLSGTLPSGWKFSQRPTISGDDSSYAHVNADTGIVTIDPVDFEYLMSAAGGGDSFIWIYVDVTNTVNPFETDQIVYKIQFTDVNEPPSVAPRPVIAALEDQVINFVGGNKIILSDVDANTVNDLADMEVTISSTTLASNPSGTFLFGGNPALIVGSGPSSLILRGRMSVLNAALLQLSLTPSPNSTESLQVSVTANDLGSGLIGISHFGGSTSRIDFGSINDAPVLTPAAPNIPASALQVPYATSVAVATTLGIAFTFEDPDLYPASHLFELLLTTGRGSVSVPDFYGASYANPIPTTWIITGTQAQLTQILNSFLYVPSLLSQGGDQVFIQVDDLEGAPNSRSNPSFVYFDTLSNNVPVVGNSPISLNYLEGAGPVVIAPGLTLSDADDLTLQSATIMLTAGYVRGEDVLGLTASLPTGVTANFVAATGELMISGSAPIADYMSLLRQVTYTNTSVNPGVGLRTLSVTVSDGVASSAPGLIDLRVSAVNSRPTLIVPASVSLPYLGSYTFGSVAFSIGAGDIDASAGTYSLRVTAQGSAGVLSLTSTNGLTASAGGVVNVYTFYVTGQLTDIDAALRGLVYTSTPNWASNDSISFELAELGLQPGDPGAVPAFVVTQALIAAPLNPGLINSAESLYTFTEGSGPIGLFPSLSLGLGNRPQFYSATLSIGLGYEQGADQLDAIVPLGSNVLKAWDTATGSLSLIGPGTLAEYQSILRSVTFSNTANNPSQALRQLSLVVSDGVISSAALDSSIDVIAVNDSPVISGIVNTQIAEDSAASNFIQPSLTLSDVDSTTLELRITASSGMLTWGGASGVPSSVTLVGNSEFRLMGNATEIAAWATQIRFTPTANFNGFVSLNWDLADDAAVPLHSTATSTIQVAAINDAPVWVNAQPIAVEQGKIAILSASSLSANDVDHPVSALSFQVRSLPQHGQLRLNGRALALDETFNQADIDAGLVSYQHDDSSIVSDQLALVVNDPAGASAVERQISVNVALRAPVFIAPPTSTSGTTTSAPPVAVAPPAADVSVKDVGATGDGGNSGSGVVAVPPLNAPANNAGRGAARAVTVQTGSTPSASAQSATGGTDIRRQEYAIPELDKVAAPVAVLAKAPLLSADRPSNNFELLRTRTVVENSVYVDQMRKVMSDSAFVNDVQKVRDDIIKFDGKVIASTTAVSASLSIGYVIWLVRGGALISSLLASIPAWQLVDPLPVLGNMGGGNDTDDDESLDDMIKKSRANRATATSATEPIKMAAQT